MTAPPQDVPTQLADLSAVPLGETPPAAIGAAVQRVLPGPPVVTVHPGLAFSSSI